MWKPIGGNLFLGALLHRKPERSGSESAFGGGSGGVSPERLLQLFELSEQAERIECLGNP